VLRAEFGNRRLSFTDDQRRGLAVRATLLGRKLLEKVATIATPDTLLNWHRKLIARKLRWQRSSKSGSAGNQGRNWKHWSSYGHGEPGLGIPSNPNLGHELARSRIAAILKRNAIEPSPQRVRTET
jgi:hypothetical protein